MSSSNQRPANRGFRSVLRCAITHYRQSPLAVCSRTLEDCPRQVLKQPEGHSLQSVDDGRSPRQGRDPCLRVAFRADHGRRRDGRSP